MSAARLAELLRKGDPRAEMLVWIVDTNRLALGRRPLRPGRIIDLESEQIASRAPTEPGKPLPPEPPDQTKPAAGVAPILRPATTIGVKAIRRSGEHWFELMGHRTDCGSSKELLSKVLCALEDMRPGTLEKLAHVRPRARRIVARQKRDLFTKQHLIDRFAEQLTHGWWYGTNNSHRQTSVWLQSACTCAELNWGTDLRTSLNHLNNEP
jgi:hypothetical protein